MLGPALSAAERQLVNTVGLEIVRAVKTGKGPVISPVGGKRMEDRSLVLTLVDGFGERISETDHRSTTQPARELGLQGIVVGDFEGRHGIDVAPAVPTRTRGGIGIEKAPLVRGSRRPRRARVDVEPQGYAYAAGSNVASLSHPIIELMLDDQVIGLCVPAMEGIGHCRCPHKVGEANHAVTEPSERHQDDSRRQTWVRSEV